MAVLPTIFRREEGAGTSVPEESTYTPMMANLVTALIVLMLAGLALTGALFWLRMRRRRAAAARMQVSLNTPPTSPLMAQKNAGLRAPAKPSHHRRTKSLTTPPDSPLFAIAETESLMDEKRHEAGYANDHHSENNNGARRDSVPQIHLTFPEELNEKTGRRESKVVIVTVSEKGAVGLSPFQQLQQQAPPAYSERDMKSLDLDRIGGLKEGKN